MKGILTDCFDESKKEVELEYEIEKDDDGQIFYLLNGVTGYESFYIGDNVAERMCKNGWCACVGTKAVWNKLYISAEEMKNVFVKEGII